MRRPNKFSAYILKIYPTDDYPSMKLLTFVFLKFICRLIKKNPEKNR